MISKPSWTKTFKLFFVACDALIALTMRANEGKRTTSILTIWREKSSAQSEDGFLVTLSE
jgi:hypothetical protein